MNLNSLISIWLFNVKIYRLNKQFKGAHACGFAGKKLNGTLGRISGKILVLSIAFLQFSLFF